MPELDPSVAQRFSRPDNLDQNGSINIAVNEPFFERLPDVTGTFNDENGITHPLENNLGIIVLAVNSLIQEIPYYKRSKLLGLSDIIKRTSLYGVSEYGTLYDRDDLFQDAVCAFLRYRDEYDSSLASFPTFIMPKIMSHFSHNLTIMAPGVKYPQNAFTSHPEKLEFVEPVDMPDFDGYGYDDDETYLSRWLPIEDVGVTPRYDVLGEPSDEVSDIVGNITFTDALNSLPKRDLEILTLYFTPRVTEKGEAQPRTLEGVSEELGLNISKEWVRQIIERSINNIRKKMIEIEKEKDQAIIDATKPKIVTSEERAIKRHNLNKQRLQELAEAKLALGGMIVNGVGVVVREDD